MFLDLKFWFSCLVSLAVIFYLLFNGSLEADLESYIKKIDIQAASVYIEDLENGEVYAVNEDFEYMAGSLFKVPILMTFLYKGQYGPNKVLLEKMIVESDNEALEALRPKMSLIDYLSLVYGIGLKQNSQNGIEITTPKEFQKVFKEIYKPRYLDPEMASKAIDLLSQTTYKNGLVAGVPEGVKVAHKYGIARAQADPESSVEINLSDCGIVFSQDPYMICVMVAGEDQESLEKVLAEISEIAYKNLK